MLTWIRRHNSAIIFALTIVIIVLSIVSAWKHNIISAKWLAQQKDSLASINSMITTILLIAGAVFSYYKFFRGRLLSLRAELNLFISVHPTPSDMLLHAITLTIKNVGSSTIWNPTPVVTIVINRPVQMPNEEISKWFTPTSPTDLADTFQLVEAGETISFFALREIPKDAWAVTYLASISADTGDVWFAARTVTNSVSSKDAPEQKQ